MIKEFFSVENIIFEGREALSVSGLGEYSLGDTLLCGQCFRYELITERDGYLHRAEIEPIKVSLPLTVEVEFNRADTADSAVEKHPELCRIDARRVRSVKEKIESYYDVLIMWG